MRALQFAWNEFWHAASIIMTRFLSFAPIDLFYGVGCVQEYPCLQPKRLAEIVRYTE